MKIMKDNQKRHEIKFIINENQRLNFIKKNNLKNLFPDRYVESIYYDTKDLLFFNQSEEGITPRKKVRIRGYNKGILNNLEIKTTQNYYREKIVIKEFKIDNYLQMIGRSGRRGMDREGHIIYANVDWTGLMKGELGAIESKYNNINNYNIIEKLNPDFKNMGESTYKNILDSGQYDTVIKTDSYSDETQNILLWKLRDYNDNTIVFINNINKLEMSCKCEITPDSRVKITEYLLSTFFTSNKDSDIWIYIKGIIRLNKLPDDNYKCLKIFQKYLLLIKNIHNILVCDENEHYKFTCSHLKDIFNLNKNFILQANILN